MANKRDTSIDILKGIGILFVLGGHSLGGYVHSLAYSFHMPLFFIVSGYFFKERPVEDVVKGGFRRLIVPVLFVLFLMLLIASVEYQLGVRGVKTPDKILEMIVYANGSTANYHKIWGNYASIGSIWFLGCLFWSKIIYNELHKYLRQSVLVIIVFALSLTAVIIGQYVVLPWSLLQAFTVLPFLWIGEVAHCNHISNVTSGRLWVMFCLIGVGWFFTTFFEILSISAFKWELYVLPNILFASAGVWVMYQISKLIEKSDYISNAFSFLGRNSIILVCFPVVETYCIPLKDIIPEGALHMPCVLCCKVLWATLAFLIVMKTPFLRKIFGVS